MQIVLSCMVVIGAAACGGAEEPEETSQGLTPEVSSGEERTEAEPSDGLQVEGILGTLSAQEVDRTMQGKMGRLAGCFSRHSGDLATLAGEIEFAFHVATDGGVMWVYPVASTVGHHEAERCLTEVAKATRFPRPHGGEAEFKWSVAFDPPSDVRAPTEWPHTHIEEVVSENAPALLAECRPAGASYQYEVTAYVAPGGQVLSVGASVEDPAAVDSVACLVEGIRAWAMPDPGSYQAKVTFDLQ